MKWICDIENDESQKNFSFPMINYGINVREYVNILINVEVFYILSHKTA